ncbi:RagB/SusD family nutrient uptake outer membrane protein [Flavobacterium branchiarum]|uniref:RagB/SusD family nutrient uptake outer membrane protein n=1 Tax=Flavobacterium branchiarum TaxID=1114870 RepID=A0ABV5FR57_9FLAO|nr:RagB/SusD family nutrient uptake outer membrane protein [Flavobacterium branchiarum]MDN3671599.1 RagB/SusD family nutrient uptake outer membrane protein [Flavobacterium branchiarum]
MKFKSKIGIIGISLLAFACTDLEITDRDYLLGSEYPENAEQALRVSTPVFAGTQPMLDNGGWWFTQEITSDEAVAPTRGSDWDDSGKWRQLSRHTWTPTTDAIIQLYRMIYTSIPRANRAIELLKEGAEANPAVQQVLAQTEVSRAYYFYLAMDNFGDISFPRTFTGADEFPARTPRAEVFKQLVADVEGAIPYLADPVAGASASAINKGTAYALLAKLYLNAEVYTGTPMWQKASDACDKVIGMGYQLEASPLASFKTANETSKENIYTIAYDQDAFKGFNLHMRTLHGLSQLTFGMSTAPWNGFATLEAHYNTFQSTDLRKNMLLVGQQYTVAGDAINDPAADGAPLVFTPFIPELQMSNSVYSSAVVKMSGVRVAKWQVAPGAKENLSNDFAIFRLADIILMKAEALVRLNGAGAGDALVNQIRSRAEVPQLSGYTLTAILAERGRELMWEGHRRQDLIRFGKYTGIWWEKTDTDPNRNIFPIPEFAYLANKNLLPQNPGY